MFKASEGTNTQNPLSASEVQYARNAGKSVSMYHTSRFGSSAVAVAEANHLSNTLDKLNVGKQVNVLADV